MNKIFEKTKSFIFSKQGSIFSSALIISSMIVVSRFFGFVRFRILSGYFPKETLDIFFASFRIPDIVFEILITGALVSSFIPIYISYQKNRKELSETISSIINSILVLLVVFILLLLIFLDPLLRFITPGFTEQQIEIVITFSRILLIGQLPFLIMGNVLTGISQAKKSFLLPAIAPVIYNLAIIAVTILFAPTMGLTAPILGVIIGSFFFFMIQLPIIYHADFSFHFFIHKTRGVIEFYRAVIPRSITVIIAQIDATIDLTLATLMGAGSYTVFYFAQHLQLLPVSVIGIAFGQASLPYLTEIKEEGRMEDFKKIVIDSVLNLFFFTIPIASFFIFARTPLTRLFFGGEMFDWNATVLTATTLSLFSLSLPFHTSYYFLTRCFYAFKDTKTPFLISLSCVALNTFLSLIFALYLKLPVWSLALSFSISMTLNVILLIQFLYMKIGGLQIRYLLRESGKMVAVTIFCSIPVYYIMHVFDGLILDTSRTLNVFFLLAIGGGVYFLLYLFLSWMLDVKQIYLITTLILKAREYRRKIMEVYSAYE